MRIEAIRATPILVPLEAPYLWSYGALDGFTKTVVEVVCDGVTGIGEAPSHACAAVIEGWAERLRGRDALDIAGLERRVLPWMPDAHTVTDHTTRGAWGGLEIALWDLRGRLWGQPVANLLGGVHRREIAFTDYFSYREARNGKGGEATVEAVVEHCLGLREAHGTTFFEGKLSDPDLRADARLVEALRDALGPDAMIRVDSNQAFSLPSALALAPALEAAGVRELGGPNPPLARDAQAPRPHARALLGPQRRSGQGAGLRRARRPRDGRGWTGRLLGRHAPRLGLPGGGARPVVLLGRLGTRHGGLPASLRRPPPYPRA